ncbi:Protein arginine N-methyltransferase 3 [Pseudolycoriella hygida]|uniref:type I protein arginine methyltransferase n=1 Tax=Pseudolycoriella hygida TaxID=35572 RepID=A0A9Q0MPV9_9DIPT|nr:Protein arginine N-methyltransferase 3 [Pseudolycoriella hygida]
MSDEDLPKLCSEYDWRDSSSDEEGWTEIDPEDDERNRAVCLFCSYDFNSVKQAMEHVKYEHDVDFRTMQKKLKMDQYSYIKMINYIRTKNVGPEVIAKAKKSLWKDEIYLKPHDEDDEWLTFDFESLGFPNGYNWPKEQQQIRELCKEALQKTLLLKQASEDMEALRKSIRGFVEREPDYRENEKNELRPKVSDTQDNGYFETYAHYGIHHDMLSDEVRTCSYRDAIMKNEETFKDKMVMDLGCGTAILSMFSSKAGAKQVFSIDQSDIIYHAMDILIKGRLEDTTLPVDKVDIIVSEWMGYFLLFEGMLDSVIYARDHHLSPNGLLMPNRCKIFLLGHGDVERHQKLISFWNNVYGFDMKCLKKEVLREASIEVCDAKYVLTEPIVIADLDIMKVDLNYSNFTSEFTLNVKTTGELTSLVGYFDTFFELPNQVEFSTSPHTTATHWKQTVFYLEDSVTVSAGDVVKGTFRCRRDPKDARSLIITVDLFGKTMKYHLN